ncbi:hypothetical protein BH09BAC4_BH09BAC4_52030 [soil metagenome]
MKHDISVQLASILGPVLAVVSSAEFLNFKIWAKVDPTVVDLNGLLLLIGGLTIIRFHNIGEPNWTVLITLLGWLIFVAGLYRMYKPNGNQLKTID